MHIKTLRKMMGLTQEQLAEFLGIERANLSMAESGKRSLPVKALVKFGELIKCLHENESMSKPSIRAQEEILKQKEKAKIKLRAHSEKCKIEIAFLEQKLKKMEANFNKSVTQINSLAMGVNPEKRRTQLMLELIELQSIEKLERFSMEAQIFLKFKISVMKMEAQYALEMAENLT